jgi:hypothetical protein
MKSIVEVAELYRPLTKAEIKEASRKARRAGRMIPRVPEDMRKVENLPYETIRSKLEASNPGVTVGPMKLRSIKGTAGIFLEINYTGASSGGGLKVNDLKPYMKSGNY